MPVTLKIAGAAFEPDAPRWEAPNAGLSFLPPCSINFRLKELNFRALLGRCRCGTEMARPFMGIDEVPGPYAVCHADGGLLAASRHGEQAQGFVQAKYTFPVLAVCSQRLCLTEAEDNSTSELREAIVTYHCAYCSVSVNNDVLSPHIHVY
jgi:hypothetical protein